MLPQDLDDWLTDAGLRTARKAASTEPPLLDEREQLLNEFSLFDAEQRNGGVSQYFCNWGMERWRTLARLAAPHLPSFPPLARGIDAIVGESEDPYSAVIESKVNLDAWYEKHQVELVTELRALWNVALFLDLDDRADPRNGQVVRDRDSVAQLIRDRSLGGPTAFWLYFGDGRTLTVGVYPPLACVQFTDAEATSHVALPKQPRYRDGHFEVSVGGTATPLERRLFMPLDEAESIVVCFVELGRMSPKAKWEAV